MGSVYSDPNMSSSRNNEEDILRKSTASAGSGAFDSSRLSLEGSPMTMSPWNTQTSASPFQQSPWTRYEENLPRTGLIGSLVREEGHIYSLATSGDLLYTGSDSKNIRVWKNLKEFSAFKSKSGLVKAIVISGEKIFTGHQDGKIRVWKVSNKNTSLYRRSGNLPTLKEIFKCSIKRSNFVEGTKKKSQLWIKHSDAISCLSLSQDQGLLYSASWDRTFKVWRISDSKCLESVNAHEDAVNCVVASTQDLVFTGSADGSVKVWRREMQGRGVKHTFVKSLLSQESAVTALAACPSGEVLYGGVSDGVVTFWARAKDLSHGGVLKGHKLAVLCLAAAEKLVFSGSADKTICIWRRDDMVHTCLSVLTGHTGPVKCLSAEEDEAASSKSDRRWRLYSGSLDKSVKVWSVSAQAIDLNHIGAMQQQMVPEVDPSWETAGSSSHGRP